MYLITAACIGMLLISHDCRGQEHLGCYADNRTDRLLPTLGEISNSSTVDTCINTCKSKGKTYAGVEFATECWCGDFHNFSRHGVVTEPEGGGHWCNFPCSGNKSQTCGGQGHLNVYSVCPRGRYHDPGDAMGKCDSECFCNASHICLYSTGQCPDGCQDGWYGTSSSHNASPTTPYSTSTSADEVSSTVVGVAIAVLLILVVIAVVLVCCYRRRQREQADSGKETRDAVTLPDDLYGKVDLEAKAACQRKRQEEDGYGIDKEGNTVVDNDLYGSVSNNSYPFEKEDTFGYVNVASKPPGWKKKNEKAEPVESYTMDDARCESDARQKQPAQSDMESVVDNAWKS